MAGDKTSRDGISARQGIQEAEKRRAAYHEVGRVRLRHEMDKVPCGGVITCR